MKEHYPPSDVTRGLLDCANAIPIACGEQVSGDNTGMPNNVDTYSCVGWEESGGEVVYELVLDPPNRHIIEADISPEGCDLDVFILASCDESDCIALTEFIGQSILVSFNSGADGSIFYPGWYIKWVKIGSDEFSPVEDSSWGSIKAVYR